MSVCEWMVQTRGTYVHMHIKNNVLVTSKNGIYANISLFRSYSEVTIATQI